MASSSTPTGLTAALRELERCAGPQQVIAVGTVGVVTQPNRAYLFTEEQWRRLRSAATRVTEMLEEMDRYDQDSALVRPTDVQSWGLLTAYRAHRDVHHSLWDAIDAGVEINDEAAVQALADMPNTPTEDQGDLAARNEEMVHDLTLDVGEVVNASQVATQEYDGTESLEYALFGGRDLVEREVMTGSESYGPLRSLLRGSLSQRMDDFYNQV